MKQQNSTGRPRSQKSESSLTVGQDATPVNALTMARGPETVNGMSQLSSRYFLLGL